MVEDPNPESCPFPHPARGVNATASDETSFAYVSSVIGVVSRFPVAEKVGRQVDVDGASG